MDLLKTAVHDKSVSGAQLLSAILSLEKAKLPVRLAWIWHVVQCIVYGVQMHATVRSTCCCVPMFICNAYMTCICACLQMDSLADVVGGNQLKGGKRWRLVFTSGALGPERCDV